ncbi:ATP-binding protein [Sphingomonas sp. CARO-RG-8B-R24-01]|uniref:ATP-binding protein n=1 Tax=Sphingomonas sp. CARO-RG-8B-R24-01 TaxID=2914831 RepID=UPI001F58BD54|nr:ATP-binding protein [Sphingomonas sp. CARO-RG-8B-R24-01]
MTDPLARIAAALERLAPPAAESADPLAHPAYVWRGAVLEPVRAFRPLPLDRLHGIDAQKTALLATVRHLADGAAAHDVLLWGARGSGKSALVKSVTGAVQADGGALALVEIVTPQLDTLPALFRLIADVPRAFVLFLDDLGFDAAADGRALRSMLDGGAEARPANARLVVTSNRRHLVPREMIDQPTAVNPRDAADDGLALADRFGLSLGFHVVDQDGYLAIVRAYADAHALPFDPVDAVGWATRRGSRSGRVAWHYVVDLAGREGRSLEP